MTTNKLEETIKILVKDNLFDYSYLDSNLIDESKLYAESVLEEVSHTGLRTYTTDAQFAVNIAYKFNLIDNSSFLKSVPAVMISKYGNVEGKEGKCEREKDKEKAKLWILGIYDDEYLKLKKDYFVSTFKKSGENRASLGELSKKILKTIQFEGIDWMNNVNSGLLSLANKENVLDKKDLEGAISRLKTDFSFIRTFFTMISSENHAGGIASYFFRRAERLEGMPWSGYDHALYLGALIENEPNLESNSFFIPKEFNLQLGIFEYLNAKNSRLQEGSEVTEKHKNQNLITIESLLKK